jgi:hypothetical protein
MIHALDNWGFTKFLYKKLSQRFLLANLSQEELKRTIFHTEQFYDECISLGIENSYTGYVFLLDHNGKIRWSASGPPSSPKEVDMVAKHIETLNPKKKLKRSQSLQNTN